MGKKYPHDRSHPERRAASVLAAAHNLTLTAAGGQLVAATPTFQGTTKTLSVTLKPGTYTFFCTPPGHRAGGMQGTLSVS